MPKALRGIDIFPDFMAVSEFTLNLVERLCYEDSICEARECGAEVVFV